MECKTPLITAIYIILNECDYIFQSLESIYPVVDHIVIVEGATQYTVRDFVSTEGLSTDGMPQLIAAFRSAYDSGSKIKWVRAGWVPDKTALRNRTLEHVPSGTEYILKIDGDELYDPEHIRMAVRAMEKDNALVAQARHILFWGSTHRILTAAGEDNYWYVPVLFRYIPNMYYADHTIPRIDPLTSYIDDPSRVITPPGFDLYHFGHVRDRRKIVKNRWERLRQMQAECTDIPCYQYLKTRDDYGLYLEAISHSKAFNLANIDLCAESIMPYNGPWPEPIKTHPFWKKMPADFGLE